MLNLFIILAIAVIPCLKINLRIVELKAHKKMQSWNVLKFLPLTLMVLCTVLLIQGCGKEKSSPSNKIEGRTISYSREVSFINTNGDTLATIKAAIAQTESERNLGLMDVNSMPENRGMLFLFDDEKPLNFWMANTPLPLDIIFVNADKKIVRIHHRAQPFSTKQFPSDKPAKYVVETNGGFCVSHDIREGDLISF